jgi:hypothetical protein
MRIPALFRELQYVGRAEGDKSTYHVFKGNLGYLVIAPNNRGGLNVNVVNLKIPDIIERKFRGQEVTGPLLAKRSGRPDLFRVPFVL